MLISKPKACFVSKKINSILQYDFMYQNFKTYEILLMLHYSSVTILLE